jgi:hypothetical protein
VVTAALVLYVLHAIAPLRLALLIALPALGCVPVGVVAVRSVIGPRAGLFAWLIGPAWGYVLSSLIALGLWTCGARGAWILAAAPVIALLPAWGFRAFCTNSGDPADGADTAHGAPAAADAAETARTTFALPTFGRRDVIAVSIALLLVPAVRGPPFAHVGERTPDGEHWRAYFTADMVWSMAVTADVAKGDLPPRNMFRNGEALHYYERRMAAALPISMIPLTKYEHMSQRVREVYAAPTTAHAHNLAQHLLIDDLLIAPPERAQYATLESQLDADPTLFHRVFHNGTISIYAVGRH